MCGIASVIQYKSKVPRPVRTKAIRLMFSALMLETEVRGEDATGLYHVHEDGDWMMAKRGEKASKWLFQDKDNQQDDAIFYQNFTDAWGHHKHDISAIVGHCRKASVGSKGDDNEDNHPFAVQVDERHAILGIHNGTLYNHEKIFDKLGGHLKRQGTVDSEALFHFLYYLTEHGTEKVTPDMLEYLARRVDGSYAVITVNSRFPDQVVMFRDSRPIELMMVQPLNIILAASDRKFLERAVNHYAFTQRFVDPTLPDLNTEIRTIIDKNYAILDTKRPFPEGNLSWGSFDSLLEKGTLRPAGTQIEKDWRASTTSVTTYQGPLGAHSGARTGQQGHYSGAHSGATEENKAPSKTTAGAVSSVKTTKAATSGVSAASPGSSPRTLPKKPNNSSEEGTVIDAKIIPIGEGTTEEKAAYEEAGMLGACPSIGFVSDICAVLGKTRQDVERLSREDVANGVGRSFFNMGYAMGKLEARTKAAKIRERSTEVIHRLERVTKKHGRATQLVWDMRQVMLACIALAKSRTTINEKNVGIVLSMLPDATKAKVANLTETARAQLFEENSARSVEFLVAKIKHHKEAAETQKRLREKVVSSG